MTTATETGLMPTPPDGMEWVIEVPETRLPLVSLRMIGQVAYHHSMEVEGNWMVSDIVVTAEKILKKIAQQADHKRRLQEYKDQLADTLGCVVV